MIPRLPWLLLSGYLAAATVLVVGLWKLGGDDEWFALALVGLGAALLALVSSSARAADAEDR